MRNRSCVSAAIPHKQGTPMSTDKPPDPSASEAGRQRMPADLHELVEALDRRVPHPDRAAGRGIASDSAKLKKGAEKRIAELEDEPARPE